MVAGVVHPNLENGHGPAIYARVRVGERSRVPPGAT
jgi:hypothetical protein